MSAGWVLSGGVVWALVGLYDWWVWSNLIASGLGQIGALIGFGILAIVSLPITIGGAVVGLLLVIQD